MLPDANKINGFHFFLIGLVSKMKIQFSPLIYLLTMFLTLVAGLSFLSCERPIDFHIPDDELFVVMNSVVNTDSLVKVNLSRSKNVLDTTSIPYVSNAQVSLYEDNVFIETLTYQSEGFYSSFSTKVKPGKEYKIVASIENEPELRAVCAIPEPVRITSLDTLMITGQGSMYSYINSMACIITIDDPSGIQNYYGLKVYRKLINYYDPTDSVDLIESVEFSSDDRIFEFYRFGGYLNPFILDPNADDFTGTAAFFSDNLLDGKKFSVRINIDNYGIFDGTYYFCVSSLSQSYYLYMQSLAQYNQADGNPFSEPVQVYSNISNGLGIFGGYSSFSDSLVFQNPYGY
jgi:hypothetical protein